ncbi:MAG TPA: site-specific DNA-methyltransferase [Acidimicrobiales bacterium]|nr:site-specific DNA-methyltransferase [Acidimicrobiales bacterium]
MSRRRRPTATSSFGVGRRESHDASGFYDRFSPPVLSADDTVVGAATKDKLIVGDARAMGEVDDASVALVVTSPPYFAGKEYEEALGEGHVPASYLGYLAMLCDVFAECVRTLEPGGRIAVNVANLGRKPYRSLSGDVTAILQDRLGLLLRGEVVWHKARGASGSCAWGSFRSPANPVLRDLTERVVIASKGRFDRALSRTERKRRGLPSEVSITKDEFIEATTDVWELPAESATRVGHPAPFPVELPLRLIELFTYRGDLVLDPFMGSGSTAVAAVRTGRHYVGYDTDTEYVRVAERRVSAEGQALAEEAERSAGAGRRPASAPRRLARALQAGTAARDHALEVLRTAGFTGVVEHRRPGGAVEATFSGRDAGGRTWRFDFTGSFSTTRGGLRRSETLWRALGRAAVLHAEDPAGPVVLLTTAAPAKAGAGDRAWRALGPSAADPVGVVHDVVELGDPDGEARLRRYATTPRATATRAAAARATTTRATAARATAPVARSRSGASAPSRRDPGPRRGAARAR